jgi:hypothetical protein
MRASRAHRIAQITHETILMKPVRGIKDYKFNLLARERDDAPPGIRNNN